MFIFKTVQSHHSDTSCILNRINSNSRLVIALVYYSPYKLVIRGFTKGLYTNMFVSVTAFINFGFVLCKFFLPAPPATCYTFFYTSLECAPHPPTGGGDKLGGFREGSARHCCCQQSMVSPDARGITAR